MERRGRDGGIFGEFFVKDFWRLCCCCFLGVFLEGGRYKRGVLGGCGGGFLKRKTDVISGVC